MTRPLPLALTAGVLLVASCSDRQSPTVPVLGNPLAFAGDHSASASTLSAAVAEKDQPTTSSLVLPYFGAWSGSTTAFTIMQAGTGRGALFYNTQPTNNAPGVTGQHAGSGSAFYALNSGTGKAASFEITNATSTNDVLRLASAGSGNLLNATQTAFDGVAIKGTTSGAGQSQAGVFTSTNPSNTKAALEVSHAGAGAALSAASTGSGPGGVIGNGGASNYTPGLYAYHNGTSNAGHFESLGLSSGAALRAEVHGSGAALVADQRGPSGDIAIFRTGASALVNQARIDRTGKGFFNGGTQTGGADMAETFEVDGRIDDYRPGDVLVISTRTDRRVTRSAEPYSTGVIGVYATKPGVLLTDRGIDESQRDMVPVGVVGVIPTRVSAENGAIRRGDILVTATTPGHAMRVDPVIMKGVKLYPTGAILGKALQEFAGPGTGTIKVLVNVK